MISDAVINLKREIFNLKIYMSTKKNENREKLMTALSDVGLLEFKTADEREAAHKLLIMMLANDAPKKRERRKNNYDPRAASEANHEITKGHH